MWVLAENGQLINLDRFYAVDVWSSEGTHLVVACSERGDFVGSPVLCSCDDEEHGKEIIQHIADALQSGVKLYDIHNAKAAVAAT